MNTQHAIVWDKSLKYSSDGNFSNKSNCIYVAVETLLYKLNLDRSHFNNPQTWNPLGKIIKPGNNVVIKVNFVTPRDKEIDLSLDQLQTVCTNPEVINPIIDYAWRALKEIGSITIVDSPIEATNLDDIYQSLHVNELINSKRKQGINVKMIDLRDFTYIRRMILDNFQFLNHSINIGLLSKKKQTGDPKGYQLIDLKTLSFFNDKSIIHNRLTFHRSDTSTAAKYHTLTKNIYSISRTVLDADVFINIPKLKTHKKSGVTLSLKNLVGITNRKHWLPHYQHGSPPLGDEYPQELPLKEKIRQAISRITLNDQYSLIFNLINFKTKHHYLSEGCWFGNDTIWRTILDLNKILFFCDKTGRLHSTPQRQFFSLVDGIIAGQGDGPLRPEPVNYGLLLAGFNPSIIDILATTAIGFNYSQNKQLINSLKLFNLDKNLVDKIIRSFIKKHPQIQKFKPATGWDDTTISINDH